MSQRKLALTTINILLRFKIIETHKKFQNQPRPIVRLRSVNFCQNF